MKQSGVFFSVFGGLMILLYYFYATPKSILNTLKQLGMYCAGVVIPLVLLLILMFKSGVFEKFWFWTVTYPGIYGSRVPLKNAWAMLKINFEPFSFYFVLPWITAGLGFIALIFYKKFKWSRLFAGIFFVFSFLPLIPGYYFRSHYFIPFLPAVGLMTGIFFNLINQLLEKHFKQIIYVTGLFFGIFFINNLMSQKDIYFFTDTDTLCKVLYGSNPFNESIPIARYLKENTKETDNIMVLGSEPQIYFYANRHSSSAYIYMYDLVFKHPMVKTMQLEMFKQVEKANPKYIVFFNIPFSWVGEKGVGDTIFRWTNLYLQSHHFRQTGLVDVSPTGPPEYLWNDDVHRYKLRNETSISIFRREDIK